tara:strand:+ start:292 stop:432 length:141 start_codon:yes stop_codon:yes gene_type:complete
MTKTLVMDGMVCLWEREKPGLSEMATWYTVAKQQQQQLVLVSRLSM